jgi:DNA modification methylase
MKPYYESDGISIYHADCREVLPYLEADALVTDPPYGLGAARQKFGGGGAKRHLTGVFAGRPALRKRIYGDSGWDDKACDDELLRLAMSRTKRQIIWGGNYFDLGPSRCYLVWDKLRGDTDYADAELAWTNLERSVRVIRWRWNGFQQQHAEERWHPTQKPLSVMAWALARLDPAPASVIDPFMGSGTTLVACKAASIPCVGIEIAERYCEIAARRLAQEVLPLEGDRILSEQRAARDAIAAGDESRGARLWIADAVAEEVFIEAEAGNARIS